MTKIELGGNDDDPAEQGGGGMNLTGMLDQMEEAADRLKSNPELAQMLGVEMPEFETAGEVEDGGNDGPALNASNLIEITEALERVGKADLTVRELREQMQQNPERIDQMISQFSE